MKKKYTFFVPLIFLLFSLLLIGEHEMWRDELQAWLLVRDSTNLISLSENLKYEGHPGLWYFILFPLTRFSSNPSSMQILHLLISTSSIYVLFKWSPFTNIQKLFLTFSYFLFYEYSLIVRSYSVSTLLIFIFCTLFENRGKNIIKISCVLALLSHTSIFGLFISLCFFLSIILEYSIEFLLKNKGTRDIWKKSNFIAFFISIFGFLTSLIQLLPPKDSPTVNTEINFPPKFSNLIDLCGDIIKSYIPIPELRLNFWGTTITNNNFILQILFILFFIYVFITFLKYFIKKPTVIFLYLSSSCILSIFFLLKFPGALRHHGFLFIILIASLWIFKYCFLKNQNKIENSLKRKVNFAATFLFGLQALAGIIAASYDAIYPFSSAKETANFLRKNNFIDSQIISYRDFAGSAVLGHIPNKKSFYYLDSASNGSYIKWNNRRNRKVKNEDLEEASLKLSSGGEDVILILNDPIDAFGFSDKNFREIFVSKDSVVADEKFYVYFFIGPNKSLDKREK